MIRTSSLPRSSISRQLSLRGSVGGHQAVIGAGGSREFPHISASGEFSRHRHEVDQPNKLLWGGARDRGKRAVAVEGSLLSRWVRIFSITTGSSRLWLPASLYLLQSDAGDDPHRPATGPAGLDVDAEYALQALRPRYCHGWHVCRFCRSKNRPSRRGVRPAWVPANPPSSNAGFPCPVSPVLLAPGSGCWGRIRRGSVSS